MSGEIQEFAILFGLAAATGIVARLLRQPLILAYMATGVLIGLYAIAPVMTDPLYRLFAELGIMFLLFLIGMEINLRSLRQVGATAAVIGLGQIVFTFAGGFIIAVLLGFTPLVSAYIAIALTFSSTIIIVKLLSEKRDLHSLYGKISIGFLLVQDFVAVLILLVLAGLQQGDFSVLAVSLTVLKGVALFVFMLVLGRTVMPVIFDKIARSPELLFTVSLAWLFVIVSSVQRFGFSIEIGGFLAGIALANSSETFQISSRIKPLRDFFLLLFFVVLGSSLAVSDLSGVTVPAVIFSVFVLVGNPLIVVLIMGAMGYHRRTSFLAGVTVAQISEFSLVLMALGQRVGHVQQSDVTLVTLVGVITITLSSYLILQGERVYRWLQHWLKRFERRTTRRVAIESPVIRRPIVLIGAHRTGQNILKHLAKEKVAVVDFNPDIVLHLKKQGYAALYGDITDPEIFDAVDYGFARLIISTSPDLENNRHFIQELRRVVRRRPALIMRAETAADADDLYAQGADYVIVPHLTAGHSIGEIIGHGGATVKRLRSLRKHDHQSRRISSLFP